MSALAYLLAVLLLAGFAVPIALAVRDWRRVLLPGWTGAPARLADAIGWVAIAVVLSELLGAVGLFRAWALVAASLLVSTALRARARRTPVREGGAQLAPAKPARRGERRVAFAGALLVLAQWAVPARISLGQGMTAPDTLWYHMPFAARFVQDGWLTHLHFVEVEPLTAFYPANSELLHAIGIALFDSHDVLSPLVNLAMLALALLAGWCIGRPYGAAPLTLVATSVALALPALWGVNAGQANNDITALAFFLAAVALLVNGAVPLAGAAAGLALGTKFSLVGPVLALAVALVVIRPRPRAVAAWALPLALTSGFWYLRNIAQTGGLLPSAPRPLSQPYEFSLAHYLTDWDVWHSHLLPGLKFGFGSVWWSVLALAGAGAVGAVLVASDRRRRLLGVVAIACALAYAITPVSAAGRQGAPALFGLNLRYATPAVALGLALLPTWFRRRRLLLAVLLATLLVTLLSPTGLWSYRRVEALGYAAAFAALAFTCLRWPRARFALAVAAVAAVAAGFFVQRHYLDNRYSGRLAALGLPGEIAHTRIGVLGVNTGYPLYGTDLSNRVVYVGRSGPHGAFTREPTCRDWRNAVNAGHFRYLVVAPVTSPTLPAEAPTAPPREAGWTDATRIHQVAGLVTVYRIDRPLDPAGCL
ncbi:MAG: hypothetical protein QOC77_910 [Thermoleophilaceae bacterium]|nr:hypothetical protein [Thermoleophilaceae bacterium]